MKNQLLGIQFEINKKKFPFVFKIFINLKYFIVKNNFVKIELEYIFRKEKFGI